MTTRRDFLGTTGTTLSGAWLMRIAPLVAATQACAREAAIDGAPFVTFTARESADFEAFSSRIIPSDDTPGAREANVVRFVDQALQGFSADLLPIIRGGLERLDDRSMTEHGRPFAEMSESRQDAVLGQVESEDPAFFTFARMLTAIGFTSNPEYGGNQNQVGWAHLGFDPAFVHQPPFGFYDRDEHGSGGAE